MFIKNIIRFFPFLFFVIILSCSNPTENTIYSFEIYFLEDENHTYMDIKNSSLNDLVLQENPIVTDEDIDTVIISYLDNNPIISYNISYKYPVKNKFGDKIRPFVLSLNGDKLFIGEFWPQMMSYVPASILLIGIRDDESWLNSNDDEGHNKIQDENLVNSFNKLGIEIIYNNIGQ
jgi:hypothetical protein